MRLTPNEIAVIRTAVSYQIQNADLFIFGSRTDDARRGGDIDVLIIGNLPQNRSALRKIKIALADMLGEQKIDVVYEQQGYISTFGENLLLDAVPI